MQSIEQFYPILNQPFKAVITSHQKPDGDAMGSSLGLYHFLKQLGHEVTVVSPTNWASFLDWMPGTEEVIDFESNKEKATNIIHNADYVFCLDFNILHRTKHLEPIIKETKALKILVDHHQQPDTPSFTYGISDVMMSSTCEMIYNFIVESGHSNLINLDIAACLYTGLMTDTGSFRFPSTTASVHKIVAHLKELGLQHSLIHENIYDNFSEGRLKFMGNAFLNRMTVIPELNTAIMAIPKTDIYKFELKTGDTEGLVNYLLSIEGIKLAAIVIDREEERKWSFRSKGNFDVNIFARTHFEGGGHANAAGGRSSKSVEETANDFKTIIKDYKSQLTQLK
ncbi:MAG: bifunctional oligoribonuclease/PAP phosphatase NrnA [Chitinophagia bacterium]|jgi:phosphoesterase RecJ-like protein|nr:bifunctional oligoribonuclease/PAP phosphatase NrnA [Chitinophagia bacterium]NDD16231.1 bifunctional oligoribonuclease/PAP phosphatase NrnA [Chitinophagia bacterium]